MTPVLHKLGASRQASSITWFALLCSLLGALWCLNLFPQGPLAFRIRTTVVLHTSRLEVLEQLLARESAAWQHPDCLLVQKMESKELQPSTHPHPLQAISEADIPAIHRVTLESVWSNRIEPKVLKHWLDELTQPSAKQLHQTETARELRWVQYKLNLAQHYLSSDHARSTYHENNRIAIQTASYSSHEASTRDGISSESISKASSRRQQAELEEREQFLLGQLELERQRLCGTVSITALSKWTPYVTDDPLLAPILGLIVGALFGAGLAVLLRRKLALGTAGISTYETTLSRLQIPLFHIRLSRSTPSHQDSAVLSSQNLKWWISGCEWSLLFWGLSAGLRFALDTTWREMCLSQPLLALARLFSSV